MKVAQRHRERRQGAYALMVVLLLSSVGLFVLASAFRWSGSTTALSRRNSEYFTSAAVAASATEKVASKIVRDFHFSGPAFVDSQLANYERFIPTSSESPLVGTYEFFNTNGVINQISVSKVSNWTYGDVQARYPGTKGSNAVFRIDSTARDIRLGARRPVRVQRDVKLASMPLFAFGIFYASDLEMNPNSSLTLSGRIHSNGGIYSYAAGDMTFLNDVTSVRKFSATAHPLDPTTRGTRGNLTFRGRNDAEAAPALLPLGATNSPLLLRSIVEVPPPGESITSAMGLQRYYNKSDLIILVSNGTSVARCGGTTVPWTNVCDTVVTNAGSTSTYSVTNITGPGSSGQGNGKGQGKGGKGKNFVTNIVTYTSSSGIQTNIIERLISTNGSFFDKRENKTVQLTEFDINHLRTNTYFRSILGRDVKSIYVGDFRTNTGNIYGIRVVRGGTLPSLGLTMATPNPLYVDGDYNVEASAAGTTNTMNALPASLVADALTVLSSNWRDTNSSSSVTNCIATNITVNAAIVMGTVPTGSGYYSGGVERSIRFLEDWSTSTFTFNGAMAVLYNSQIAAQPDQANPQVYRAPLRRWAFDQNFYDPAKLPPGTPLLRTVVAAPWKTVAQ